MRKLLAFTIVSTAFFFVLGCNNSGKKTEEKDTTTTTTAIVPDVETGHNDSTLLVTDSTAMADPQEMVDAAKEPRPATNEVGNLMLSKSDLVYLLMMYRDHKQLHFTWAQQRGHWVLRGTAHTASGHNTNPNRHRIASYIEGTTKIPFDPARSPMFVLTRGTMKAFFGEYGRIGQDNIIRERFLENVTLIPCERNGRLVFFLSYVSNTTCPVITPMQEDGDLKPSPPADAFCNTSCDDFEGLDIWKKKRDNLPANQKPKSTE